MTALHALTPLDTVSHSPDTVSHLDRLISRHTARAHAAKLAVEETGRALAEARERVAALSLELGRRQDAHREAGADLVALCRTRGIVGRG